MRLRRYYYIYSSSQELHHPVQGRESDEEKEDAEHYHTKKISLTARTSIRSSAFSNLVLNPYDTN